MELKLLIRQLIRYDASGTKEQYVTLQGGRLVTVTGTLPSHRKFVNYGNFLDITDAVGDLHQLKL
ncbi:MAG: hypothetical protein KDC07_10100, partial [Chitinophagaceae bacterium]|nr:hypothetical protein [Chitinophagaceae bacterium]